MLDGEGELIKQTLIYPSKQELGDQLIQRCDARGQPQRKICNACLRMHAQIGSNRLAIGIREHGGRGLRLPPAQRAQPEVEVPLDDAPSVPFGLAVADEEHLGHGADRTRAL